jgi:hypothetical protein
VRSVTLSVKAAHAESDLAPALSRYEMLARWNALRGDAYALDTRERFVENPRQRLRCQPENMVLYRGDTVRFYGSLSVDPAFRERLQRFEEVVAEVAREIYGRAPHRIQHYGAYSCRASRNRSQRLSEHALGNAVDIVGFDFAPAKKKESLPEGLPRALKYGFQVRVAKHWNPKSGANAALHSKFLRSLTDRLIGRDDVFRGFVGPGHQGHSDHLHFDMAPWRYVRL